MNQTDTIHLLGQCQSGVQMAVSAINEVLPVVEDLQLRQELTSCKEQHEQLGQRAQALLTQLHQPEQSPSPVALGMSWLKTNVKLAVMPGDHSVADLVTDGLNMGVKSLTKCRNRYTGASESAKQIAHDLISSELSLTQSLRQFL